MTKKTTNRIEVLTIILCLVFLPLLFAASGRNGRERAKRMICLANLRQLTSAWNLYADDNDDRIVNGAPLGREGYADPGTGNHYNEIPWVGRVYSNLYDQGISLPEQAQIDAIQAGALWPYVQQLRTYRCPNGVACEMLTYAAMDGVNGLARNGTTSNLSKFLKKRSYINGSPALRMVYIDEGQATPDSFAVNYDNEAWWDDPPMRHGDGATLSFMDGHTEYHQWQGVETIEYHQKQQHPHHDTVTISTIGGFNDLHYIQKGCWGQLGYTPSMGDL